MTTEKFEIFQKRIFKNMTNDEIWELINVMKSDIQTIKTNYEVNIGLAKEIAKEAKSLKGLVYTLYGLLGAIIIAVIINAIGLGGHP